MSGSTIGGIAGAAIGFWAGGPEGARWGFMIGSAVGGYVDPAQIEGPRLTDAQTQLSNEGVPRAIIYGTCAVAGNIIQVGPLVEHKRTERASKGGPEQTTYTYTRTVAIRICEAAPNGGTMRLRRVWMDDKLIYDTSSGSILGADSQKFASILTFYDGGETQLPDPSLEALPEEYGGGVGNVPAYRGSCYAVLTDLDCTDRQGAVPQFRWEVCSEATESYVQPTVGGHTDSYTLTGEEDSAYIDYAGSGVAYGIDPTDGVSPDSDIDFGTFSDSLSAVTSGTITNAGDSPNSSTLQSRGISPPWHISADGVNGRCKLLRNGHYMADLRPIAESPTSWWFNEGGHYPEYGGLVWFDSSSVVIGVRTAGNSGTTYNRIYRWPLEDAEGAIVAAENESPLVTTGTTFWVHMDRGGTVRAVAADEAELVTYDADLSEQSRVSLPMSLTGFEAFAVDSGLMFILFSTGILRVYDLDTLALQQTVTLSGSLAEVNNQIICSDNSIFIRSGVNVKRVAYSPSCLVGVPEGWYMVPDAPAHATNGDLVMPLCSEPQSIVTPGMIPLSEIVSDLSDRAGVDSSQLDVTAIASINVRGYPVGRETSAAEAIRELQSVFLFDMPEWGNGGETATKLRAVLRGGASVLTLTDDDLVDSDEDQETRLQQVEFPRKLSFTAADPTANYEPVTEAAERETENVKAVGERRSSTSVVLVRDEIKQIAEKQLKLAWETAAGKAVREVPEEFSIYTPSDRLVFGGRTYRIDRVELLDGYSRWELIRDGAWVYSSSVTGATPPNPSAPVSSVRGPTMLEVMNLPSLRSADNVPGVYLAAQGMNPGWIGADIYLSVDGGVSEQKVATILDPATMGTLAEDTDADGNDSSGLISVQLYPGGELDSITDDQMAARLNGFAIITSGVAEVGQFQDAEESSAVPGLYDLTNVLRGQLGTTAATHLQGDRFVLLNEAVMFLPLDADLSGEELIFRAVSIGTAPANNPTTTITFEPPTFVIDGGEVVP